MTEIPTEEIDRIYYTETAVRSLDDHYSEARERFVEEHSKVLLNHDSVPIETEDLANNLSEAVAEEAYGELIDMIDGTGLSLWITLSGEDEPKIDLPVYVRSPTGTLVSKDTSVVGTDNIEPSTEFFVALSTMTEDNSESGGTDWGGIEENIWNSLTDSEQELVHKIKQSVISSYMTPEVALLLEYADEMAE